MSIKSIILTISLLFLSIPSFAAEKYKLDVHHTNIHWGVSHFGFADVTGRFGIKEGYLVIDKDDINKSSMNVTIDVEGLVTGMPKFDEHLKSSDFLDTDKFPTATFKSTKIKKVAENIYNIKGDLTLHGVTKSINLKAKLNKVGIHPRVQRKTVGFSAKAIIKRSDFLVDKYAPSVANEVRINIECEANLVK